MATAIRTGSSHQGAFLCFFSGRRRRQNCQRGGGSLGGGSLGGGSPGGGSPGAGSPGAGSLGGGGAAASDCSPSGAALPSASAGDCTVRGPSARCASSTTGESAVLSLTCDSAGLSTACDSAERSTVGASAGSPLRAASSDSSWPARASPPPAPRCACSSAIRSSPASGSAGDRLPLLLDLGGLAAQIAQIVELGPSYVTAGDDFDLVDDGRVDRERAFHADAEADLADGERLAQTAALPTDYDALEDLDTRTGTLDHAHVDLQGVAGPKIGNVGTQRLGIHGVERVHRSRILRSVCSWPACMSVVPTLTGVAATRPTGAGQPLDGAIRDSPTRNRALLQQVWAALLGAQPGPLAAPARDFAVVTGQQHVRDGQAPPLCGPGVCRTLEQAIAERIVCCRFGVAEYAGQ